MSRLDWLVDPILYKGLGDQQLLDSSQVKQWIEVYEHELRWSKFALEERTKELLDTIIRQVQVVERIEKRIADDEKRIKDLKEILDKQRIEQS